MSYEAFDRIEARCPQLGGEVTFGYCRALDGGLPCPRALVCYELRFPVAEYFRRVLRAETFARVFTTPAQSRLDRLFAAAAAARARADDND